MTIRKDSKGRYYFKISLGTDPRTGQRIQTTRRGYKTMLEAKKAYSELMSEHGKKTLSVGNIKFKDFLFDTFFPWYKSQVKESTYENRLPLAKKHFVDFYHIQIAKITPIQIQNWQTRLTQDYSSEYVRLLHAFLSVVLKRAVRLTIIEKNPAEIAGNVKKSKTTIQFWTRMILKR